MSVSTSHAPPTPRRLRSRRALAVVAAVELAVLAVVLVNPQASADTPGRVVAAATGLVSPGRSSSGASAGSPSHAARRGHRSPPPRAALPGDAGAGAVARWSGLHGLLRPIAAMATRRDEASARGPSRARPAAPSGAPAPGPPGAGGDTGAPAVVPAAALENPPGDIAPEPDFLESCSGTVYDDSTACVRATVAALDRARALQGLGPFVLPGDWWRLTPSEQLFVSTNLERTARDLEPLSGMAVALDGASAAAAAAGTDPAPPLGFPTTEWGGNWAGAVGNPLEAVYFWMYDDGPGSSNIDCPPAGGAGCWGHRDNVLLSLTCRPCVMGVGFAPGGWHGDPSWAELLVDTPTVPAFDFTWGAP